MKAKKALRKALEQPWLYEPEELIKLQEKLDELESQGVQELWHRRTTMGFSNSPEMLNEKKKHINPTVKGRYSCPDPMLENEDTIQGTFDNIEDLTQQIGEFQQ